MKKQLSNYSNAIKIIIIMIFLGLGLYFVLGSFTLPGPAADTPDNDSSPVESVNWEEHSIVPTSIQSYDNGTYSVTLNNTLSVKFIRLNDNSSIKWPKEKNTEKPAVTLRSDTLFTKLAKSLKEGIRGETEHKLGLTDVSLTPSDNSELLTRARLTFNEVFTINGVKLMEGEAGPWLAWPSRQFEGEWVDLVESDDDLKNELINRLQKAMDNRSGDEKTQNTGELPRFSKLQNSIRADVIKVYDGDTLKAKLLDGTDREVVVRIQGIDCPESSRNEKCKTSEYREGMSCAKEIKYGKRASRIAKKWLSSREIFLVPTAEDGFEKGHYDRWIAYVRLNTGIDYGLKMVNKGYCKDTSRSFSHQRGETYRRYETPLKPLQ